MTTPNDAAADRIINALLSEDFELVCWEAPAVPSMKSIAAYEAEALRISAMQARVIARSAVTVRPGSGR